ncbi:MAG: hypothetical protein ACR652_08330 [Methylocystis sp.]|uniref:hypothetical protein n=1 Tax=Methylocystis sp. TaxID=1911079 RepID=UPI003DA64C12
MRFAVVLLAALVPYAAGAQALPPQAIYPGAAYPPQGTYGAYPGSAQPYGPGGGQWSGPSATQNGGPQGGAQQAYGGCYGCSYMGDYHPSPGPRRPAPPLRLQGQWRNGWWYY